MDIIGKQLKETLRALSGRITEYAANLEDRAIAILSGGPDHPKEEFRGEKAPSYLRTLLFRSA
jgi:hypothetical protein